MAEFNLSKQQQDSNRISLVDKIPLDTPLSMQIELASACNLKCSFCMHHDDSLIKDGRLKIGCMSMDTFLETVSGLKEFPQKLKFITLQSRGESLLNKNIIPMLNIIKKAQVAEKIGLYTNGILLTQEIADGFIDSGLDVLHISINGVNAQQYKRITKTEVDFENLIKNIKYFYTHKKNTYLYIKAINCDLSKHDKDKFIELFKNISDDFFIEEPVDAWQGAQIKKENLKRNRYQTINQEVQICPRIFFACVVHFDGTVVACDHDWSEQEIIGNVCNEPLLNIWKGKIFEELRDRHLCGYADTIKRCRNCIQRKECLPKDNIDALLKK